MLSRACSVRMAAIRRLRPTKSAPQRSTSSGEPRVTIKSINIDYDRIAAVAGWTVEKVTRFVDNVRSASRPLTRTFTVREDGQAKRLAVTRVGIGPIKTPYGRFWQVEFNIDDEWKHYQVLVKASFDVSRLMPKFQKRKQVIIRPDSGCATGQRFTDLTCDCREQLHVTMKTIAQAGQGLIVHMPTQDGRGKGLGFKLGTLWLQDELNVNTVESASMLANDGNIDVRTYAGVIGILKFLGVPNSAGPDDHGTGGSTGCRLLLAANNPEKARVFAENGFKLAGREPVTVPPTNYTRHHLRAKKTILGHDGLTD